MSTRRKQQTKTIILLTIIIAILISMLISILFLEKWLGEINNIYITTKEITKIPITTEDYCLLKNNNSLAIFRIHDEVKILGGQLFGKKEYQNGIIYEYWYWDNIHVNSIKHGYGVAFRKYISRSHPFYKNTRKRIKNYSEPFIITGELYIEWWRNWMKATNYLTLNESTNCEAVAIVDKNTANSVMKGNFEAVEWLINNNKSSKNRNEIERNIKNSIEKNFSFRENLKTQLTLYEYFGINIIDVALLVILIILGLCIFFIVHLKLHSKKSFD